MCNMKIRRHVSKIYSNKLLVLAISFAFTMFLLNIREVVNKSIHTKSDVFQIIAKLSNQQLSHRQTEERNIPQNRLKSKTECPMVEFFATVDATAKGYHPDLICQNADAKTDIICQIYFRQIGLEHLAKESCKLDNPDKVPRVVYFVIFGTYTFKFWHYIAVVAAKRFVKPTAIYVIGDQHPMGRWWQQVLRDVIGVRFVYREIPTNISGLPVRFRHHFSDVVRLQTLFMNGGIYLDADMVVVRDLEPLLDYDITLGMVENGTGMGNAFMVAKRHSPFIQEWYEQYKTYRNKEFYWNSLQVPRNMWFKNSSRVHMESNRLYRPNWFESDLLFKRSDYPWRNNYAIHVWTNKNPVPKSPEDIQTANSAIAQIFRYAMYGDWKPRRPK